jgi:hypothetical protein
MGTVLDTPLPIRGVWCVALLLSPRYSCLRDTLSGYTGSVCRVIAGSCRNVAGHKAAGKIVGGIAG